MMLKPCTKCSGPRNRSNTYKNRARPDGLDEYCKVCRTTYFSTYRKTRCRTDATYQAAVKNMNKRYYKEHKLEIKSKDTQYDRSYFYAIKRKYGLDRETYERILKNQNSVCAVCRHPDSRRLVVDHDHKINRVRGLLCGQCNTAIGLLKENPKTLKRAINYLNRSSLPDQSPA